MLCEHIAVSLPAGVVLLAWMIGQHGPPAQVSIGCIALPTLLVLICTAGAMGLYNLRVTGNAFHMPYQLHEATYAVASVFLWQRPRPEPVYRHEIMRDFHTGWALKPYLRQRSLSGFVRGGASKVQELLLFYLGPVLTVPFVMLPWVLRSRWMRFALLTCGVLEQVSSVRRGYSHTMRRRPLA
jgi:hypothetical protein